MLNLLNTLIKLNLKRDPRSLPNNPTQKSKKGRHIIFNFCVDALFFSKTQEIVQ